MSFWNKLFGSNGSSPLQPPQPSAKVPAVNAAPLPATPPSATPSPGSLVGSIFKGRVRNVEDGLKALFVDIGVEKTAFLHYWDIMPTSFDSSVEVVEREALRQNRPRITQKDIPRLYPPGCEIIVQVTKESSGTKGPRVTTNIVLPGCHLVLLPNSDQSGISRKIENTEERQRLKIILRELSIPDGMGVIMRTTGAGQQKSFFVSDLDFLLGRWREIQDKIKTQPPASCVFRPSALIQTGT